MSSAAPAPDGVIRFSHHACERWTERARPALTARDAAAELERLRELARVELRSWTVAAPDGEPHLVLGQFRFPLVRRSDGTWVAVTCVDERRHGRTGPRPGRGRARDRGYRRARHVDWAHADACGLLDED